jgi:hypothetical protein
LWSGAQLGGDVEDHHIYPKTLGRKGVGTLTNLDSICNLVPLTKESNRQIADSNPHDYLLRLKQRAFDSNLQETVQKRLSESMIPYDIHDEKFHEKFTSGNYPTFLRDRAQMLLSQVRKIIGEALVTDRSSDDDEM